MWSVRGTGARHTQDRCVSTTKSALGAITRWKRNESERLFVYEIFDRTAYCDMVWVSQQDWFHPMCIRCLHNDGFSWSQAKEVEEDVALYAWHLKEVTLDRTKIANGCRVREVQRLNFLQRILFWLRWDVALSTVF